MKTPAERGPIGAWAYQARDDAGLSVPQVVELLAAKGSAVTESTIRGIEGGSKKPGRRTLRELAAIYGSVPPGEVDEPTDDLVSAINRQALAIEALASAIERDRSSRAAWERGLLEGLRELLGTGAGRSAGRVPRTRERSPA